MRIGPGFSVFWSCRNIQNNRGSMTFAHLFRWVFALVLVLAVFWGGYAFTLLKTAERHQSEETTRWLSLMTVLIEDKVRMNDRDTVNDPVFLQGLARQIGAHRISILGPDGQILMDTLDPDRVGKQDPLLGISPDQRADVSGGAPLITAPYSDRGGRLIRSNFIPITNQITKTPSVLRVDIEVRPLDSSGPTTVILLLLKLVGGAMVVVLVFYLLRVVKGNNRSAVGGESEMGGTAAVVDTFHGLVRQLKEKEQELERLRDQAEERAADVESYNENILQSVTSGVITFNTERTVTTFNHAAEDILGLVRSEAIGKTCEEVFGHSSNVLQLLDGALEHQTTITRRELKLSRPDSSGSDTHSIWVGVSTSLLRDGQNQLIGTTFVFTDLTEIKDLQEQVELKRRLTVLGEMSAGIAHEFRNYMGSVMGFTKLLSKKLPVAKKTGDDGQEMVASIMRELTAMNQLIEQLLSFGRRAKLNLQPVMLEPMIRQLLESLMSQAEGPRPESDVVIPSGLPEIRVDEVLMRQAIGNLIQNALEAMPQGGKLGIWVTAPAGDRARGPKPRGYRRELFLEIRDTGVGIPKDKLEKIFLPFFTSKEKGTGMGLALTHKIILSHGGRIEVDSLEGRGTAFRIFIPVVDLA